MPVAAAPYSLSGGSLTVGDYEAVGYSGTGSFTQSGGTHTVTALYLGTDAGASGSYTLSDSGSGSLSVGGNEYIGYSGTGTFTQTGGSNTVGSNLFVGTQGGTGSYSQSGGSLTVSGDLYLGNSDKASGSYNLSDGSLSVGGNEYVGNSGSGAFTQTGGTHTVTGDFYVGNASGSSGTYILSSGSLSTGDSIIGNSGTGTFTQSGGTHTVDDGTGNGELWVGAPGGSGAYSLSGGSLAVKGSEYLGAGGGTGTFTQSGGSHTVSVDLFLGAYSGTGTYTLNNGLLAVSGFEYLASGTFTQSGGSHTAQIIILGPGSTGIYNLSGGSLQTSGGESIGDGGRGIFNQSGGTNIVSGLSLGTDAYTGSAGTGAYNLSGGSLQSYYGAYIGVDGGSGTFTQGDGTHTISGSLYLGENGGTGTYNLSGGSLSANAEDIGDSGTGSFTQSGGTHTLTGNLTLANSPGSSGTYNLSHTGSLAVTGNEYVGNSGTGTFTQTGGTNTVSGNLIMAANPGSSGTYNFNSGSLSAAKESVGSAGTGSFIQTSGINTVDDGAGGGELWLGAQGGSGAYSLGGGTLTVTGVEYLGAVGQGTFTQSGGGHTVPGFLFLGTYGGTGTYSLSTGSLLASYEYIGTAGTGTFTQSGGSHTVDDGSGNGALWVGTQGGSGTYNLNGGSLTVNGDICIGASTATGTFSQSGGSLLVSGGESIGDGGSGSFDQSGGANNAGGLAVGTDLVTGNAGTGTYNLSAGSLQVGYMGENIGYGNGSGTFTQSGGSHVITGEMYLGNNNGTGTYNLSNGSLSLSGVEYIGYNTGSGTFAQSGGSHVTTTLIIGNGGTGTYNLDGGNLSNSASELIGCSGTGIFTQSGGTNTLSSNLHLGMYAAGMGTYTLSGGSLTAANEYVGETGGTGIFAQSGGTNTVTGALTLAAASSASGTYSLSGGSLSAATVNLNAGGVFTQTGGTFDAATINHTGGTGTFTDLYLGRNAGSSTYTFSGGSVTAANEYVGYSGSCTFTQSGGSNTVTNSLTLAANPGSLGAYDLGGGNLTVDTLTINAGGAFTQTGGTLSYSTLNLRGGGFTGDLVNTGLLTGTGPIIGKVTNDGTVSPGYSPGTLNIVGSYTQTAAGTYTAEVASAGSYDQISVTGAPGTATLAGTIAPTLLNGYRPRGNQVFPGVVTTTGGVTGAFNSILNQQISPTLFWQARYNPTSVDLWVQRNYTNSGLSLNSNQQGVGTMLNSVAGATSGDLDTVLNAIDYLPNNASGRDAFKQISPEKAGSLTSLGFVAASFQMRNLATRTTNLRFVQGESSGGSGLTSGGLSFNYSKLDGVMLAYNSASLSNLFSARKEFQAPEGHWGLYMDGGAAFGSQNSSINQTGYNFTLGGFTLGADYRLRDNLLVGLATGYSNTGAGFYGSGGSVNANTVPFNAYAAYFPGSLYAYGSLGYALNLYDLNRGINFNGIGRSASSSTTGNQFNLYGETGYDLKLSRFILTPSATLSYSTLWVDGFTEQGAGALNLKVGSQNANSVQTGLGGRLTVPLKVGSVKVVPQGYAFYQHEFANGSRGLSASLSQGSSSFNFQTDAAKRNYALVGASITAGLRKNLYAQVNYNAEVGRSGSSNQSINAGLRYEF